MSDVGGPLMAGWYQDPRDDRADRFWDGDEWTEKTRPRPVRYSAAASPPTRPRRERESKSAVVVAGYVFAVLIPLLGFILGLTQINRNRDGLWIVLGSIFFGFLWFKMATS